MKRTLSILLACLLLCSVIPFSVFAADDAFRVVISLEGFTLGQGYYVEPTAYSLDQINTLVKKDGYGPYTEDDLTAGMAMLAMLNDHNIDYTIGYGSWTDSLYISDLADLDKGTVNFPAVISANGGPSNDNYTPNTDKNLGESDFVLYSGWMVCVNNACLPVSASNYVLKKDAANSYANTYVIRWQFSLMGGLDLGWGYTDFYTGNDVPAIVHPANKDKAMIAYAESTNAGAKAKAKTTLEKLDATQEEVDSALAELTKTPTIWDRIVMFFDNILSFFRRLLHIG